MTDPNPGDRAVPDEADAAPAAALASHGWRLVPAGTDTNRAPGSGGGRLEAGVADTDTRATTAEKRFGTVCNAFPDPATAVVLAGGRSRRTGREKSMLPVAGRPLIEHLVRQLQPAFPEILISADAAARYKFLGLPVVIDKVPCQGPLMGIASALAASANDLNFVVACDIPDICLEFVASMLQRAGDCDGVVPVDGAGRYEPLLAVYRKSMLPAMNAVLGAGRRRIAAAFPLCRMRYVDLGNAAWLRNLNSLDAYRQYIRERHEQEWASRQAAAPGAAAPASVGAVRATPVPAAL